MSAIRPGSLVIARPELVIAAAACAIGLSNLAIADRLLPAVNVPSRTGEIWKIPAEVLARIPATDRERGSGFNRIRTKFTSDSYMTKQRGLEEQIPDEDILEFGQMLSSEISASTRLIDTLIRVHEKRVADKFNTTEFPLSGDTGVSVGTAWTSASATPAANVDAAAENIRKRTGVPKSMLTLMIPRPSFNKLPFITDYITKMKLDSAGMSSTVTEQQAAIYFGVKEVVIGELTYVSSDENASTTTFADIWNKDRAVLLLPMSGLASFGDDILDARVMGLGCRPRWGAMDNGSWNIETYGEDAVSSSVVRASAFTTEMFINKEYCNLIGNINP